MRFLDYGQIAPTGTTVNQYISGTAVDFSDFYASQGGNIQYTVSDQGKISGTNPGVFFTTRGFPTRSRDSMVRTAGRCSI